MSEYIVHNFTDRPEQAAFDNEREAVDFAVDTNGVLEYPDGHMVSYLEGEEPETI